MYDKNYGRAAPCYNHRQGGIRHKHGLGVPYPKKMLDVLEQLKNREK